MLIEVTAHEFSGPTDQLDSLTQYIPLVYFRQSVYVDFLPPILFQPETRSFIETTATFRPMCATPVDELACAYNEFLYVLINAVQAPKKVKRPADDVSYPELTLLPAYAYAEISIRDLLLPENLITEDRGTEPNYTYLFKRRSVPLIFPTAFSSNRATNLVITVKIVVPNPTFHELYKVEPVLNRVEMLGSFSNMPIISHSILPAFGWLISLYLPGLPDTPLVTVYNGHIQSAEQPSCQSDEAETLKDVLTLSATKQYQIVFPEYRLLYDQDAMNTGISAVTQLAATGEKPVAKGSGVDTQAVASTVLSLLTDCYHIGVPASTIDKKLDAKKKAIEVPKPDGVSSASYGGVTFNDTYNALRELLQATYTNAILKHYDDVEKEVATLDESTVNTSTKGGKQQKVSHPSLDPKNQIKKVSIVIENGVEFLRFPLFYDKKHNTRQILYISKKSLNDMRSVILSGTESCCKLVLQLESLPDGALLNCMIGGNTGTGRPSISDADIGNHLALKGYACESYIDMRSVLTDMEAPVNVTDPDEEQIPLCNNRVIVSFSNELLTYTEDTVAVITEQIMTARSQLEALPAGQIAKTDLAEIQRKMNTNFGIVVHPIVTNIACPIGTFDITQLPLIQDYDTILEKLKQKIMPLTELLPRLQDGCNSVNDYVITLSDLIKRLFTDTMLPPAQKDESVDQSLLLRFKENMRKVFMDKSIQGAAAEAFNSFNHSLTPNSRNANGEKLNADKRRSPIAVDLLLSKYVREFKEAYVRKAGKAMPIDLLHHKLVCAAKEAYLEAKQKQRRPEELIEYGNALLFSKTRHEAHRAIDLFSAALVRERQRRQCGEHSMIIEAAIEGLLRAFIFSRNKTGISRSLLRVFSIPFLHNSTTKETGTIILSRLVLLTCHELITSGEDEYLALSLLYCAKDLFNFDFSTSKDKKQLAERIFLKVTCIDLLKVLNFSVEYNELKMLLLREIRKTCIQNKAIMLLNLPPEAHNRGSTNYVSDDYILVSMRLALSEYLLLEGSVAATHKLVTQIEIPTSLTSEQYMSMVTKKTILLARCSIMEGRLGDAKALLLHNTFLSTQGNGDFNPFVLFQDIQNSASEISVSYLDLLNQSLDINTPGLLGHLALIGATTHQLPVIFSIMNRDLAKYAIAHAIQGDFNNVIPMSVWNAASNTSGKGHTRTRAGDSKVLALQEHILNVIPNTTMVSPVLLNDVRSLTFASVIFNSRVSMDMLLQTHVMYSSIVTPTTYYGGLLDCPILTGFDLYQDTYLYRILLGLCARHIPAQDCIPFVIPFEKPSEDEFSVAVKVFESIRRSLEDQADNVDDQQLGFQQVSKSSGQIIQTKSMDQMRSSLEYYSQITSISGSFTSDYLGLSLPQTAQGVAQLAESISARLIAISASTVSLNYFSSELLGIAGIIMLYAEKQDHLKVLTRAAELDAFSFPAWCGLALSLSSMLAKHVEGRVHKFSLDQIRAKIVECTNRMLEVASAMNIVPFSYASIAITQSLLDTMAEDTTILSQTALKLIDKVRSDIPLIPLCINTSKAFSTYFYAGASLQSSWFINRLKALANVSCGTLVDVADSYLTALKGIGGVLPGRSVAEVAERVLLMAETSYSYEVCNRIKDAEDVMNNGLTRLK